MKTNDNHNLYDRSLDEFIRKFQPKDIIKNAIREIVPNKRNWKSFCILVIISIILSLAVAFNKNTISIVSNIANKMIDIQLAVFGSVLAIYSIILVLLDDEFTKLLAKLEDSEKENKTELNKSIQYMESVLYLYLFGLMTSVFIYFVCLLFDNGFLLFSSEFFSSFLCALFIIPYLSYSIRIIYELKSIVFNTAVLLRYNIAKKLLKFVEEENSQDKK